MTAINTPTYMRLRDQMRDDIVAGVWPLGSHVTLAQLSSHYGVSANPVREALLQLQGEGAVAMRMNRGAVIPAVDAKYIDDVYKVRGALQCMLAREAARRATPAQVQALSESAKRFERAASAQEAAAVVEANREFHRTIDAIADNPIAVDLLAGRSALVDGFRRSVGYKPARLDEVVRQHRRIVAAIAAHDEEAAAQATLDHTDSARRDLLAICRARAA
jgi:DNA-binding GntR family transcriptional regulator